MVSVIERHGFAVRACENPEAEGCDLLDHGACTLVQGADVVVNILPCSAAARQVLDETTRLRRPPTVVAAAHLAPGPRSLDSGPSTTRVNTTPVTLLGSTVTPAELVDVLTAAVDRSSRGVPAWGDGFC